jgi:hypothetical protein
MVLYFAFFFLNVVSIFSMALKIVFEKWKASWAVSITENVFLV